MLDPPFSVCHSLTPVHSASTPSPFLPRPRSPRTPDKRDCSRNSARADWLGGRPGPASWQVNSLVPTVVVPYMALELPFADDASYVVVSRGACR